jgi:hypothetical protein
MEQLSRISLKILSAPTRFIFEQSPISFDFSFPSCPTGRTSNFSHSTCGTVLQTVAANQFPTADSRLGQFREATHLRHSRGALRGVVPGETGTMNSWKVGLSGQQRVTAPRMPNCLPVESRDFLGIYGALLAHFCGILGAEVRHSGGTYSYMFLY